MLIVKIENKTITLTEKDYFIRGTVGAKCQVIFDDCWDNYVKTIVFKHASSQIEPINLIVQSKFEEITIPWEILHTSGVFKIGFYATSENEVFPTLWSELIEIRGGTVTDGASPSKYTPNEIEQLKTQKQDKLIPGSGIDIKGNVISSVGGGGSGGIVDTTYNPESYNAQSGVALSKAFYTKVEVDTEAEKLAELLRGEMVSENLLNEELSKKADLSNKVTNIDENSTDEQYPSAKAVYTALTQAINTAIGEALEADY